MPEVANAEELATALHDYALRQLTVVLTPALMQLRRLIIAEATRFPELGAALYNGGPGQAIASLSKEFARWIEQGLLRARDPTVAATHFNWLVMGEPVNRVMMMGDGAIPGRQAMKRYAADAVTAFLAAYGTEGA
jgi:AcrR family transcriptional regulator